MSIRTAFILAVAVLAVVAGYGLVIMFWSYSSGERAGWVQKFSNKGWLCKTRGRNGDGLDAGHDRG
jgi:hypothetical protein